MSLALPSMTDIAQAHATVFPFLLILSAFAGALCAWLVSNLRATDALVFGVAVSSAVRLAFVLDGQGFDLGRMVSWLIALITAAFAIRYVRLERESRASRRRLSHTASALEQVVNHFATKGDHETHRFISSGGGLQ